MIVTINGTKVAVPQHWNELSTHQVLTIYGILQVDTADKLLPTEVFPAKRIKILQYFLSLSNQFMKDWEADCFRTHGEDGEEVFLAELSQLLKCTNFLFDITEEEDNTFYQLRLDLTKNPFPILERKKQKKQAAIKLYGPANGLENLSLAELGTSFSLFEAYLESGEEALIDELLATIYRPHKAKTKRNKRADYDGDRRMPLIGLEHMVAKRQKIIQQLPRAVKSVLLFWFASCRQQIVQQHPDVFKRGEKKKGKDFGWGGVLMALAGSLVHLEEVAKQPYQNGLVYISYLEDQRQRLEVELGR